VNLVKHVEEKECYRLVKRVLHIGKQYNVKNVKVRVGSN
jgi:hypothetical protein